VSRTVHHPRRRLVAALGVTQVVSWGVLYYAFPVLSVSISDDTGWPMRTVTGAFTVGLITAAIIGIPIGKALDRWGPWPITTGGSVLATAALIAVAASPTAGWFAAAWTLAGVAMAAVLYQPAFAAITRWFAGEARIRALTALTLAGGLASTAFAPLTAALAERFDWRGTYLVLAAILATVTIPLHAVHLRRPWPAAGQAVPARDGSIVRSRRFALLAAAFTLSGFALTSVVISLVPLLTARGASLSVAAWALGLGGVGQVVGRLGYGLLAKRLSVVPRTVAVLATGGLTTALLGALSGPMGLLFAVAMVAGAVRGISTLLQASAVPERWGTARYGTHNATLGAPVMLAVAVAPLASTTLADAVGGYSQLFGVLAAVSVAASVLALGTGAAHRLPSADHVGSTGHAPTKPT
jgi:MFS family permease